MITGVAGTVADVDNGAYIAVLVFCFFGTVWLEVLLRTRVYRRWLRLLLSVGPAAVVFVIWDLYAIGQQHWDFDSNQITGIYVVGPLPIDELLFFLVIPCCAVLTLEAVRATKGWTVGDEAPAHSTSTNDSVSVDGRGQEGS